MKRINILFVALLLTACGARSSLDGTYSSTNDKKTSLVFSANGKLNIKTTHGEKETSYHLDGDKLTFLSDNGFPITLTLESDGSLSSPVLGTLKKN